MGKRTLFLNGQIGRVDPRGQQGAQIVWVELDIQMQDSPLDRLEVTEKAVSEARERC